MKKKLLFALFAITFVLKFSFSQQIWQKNYTNLTTKIADNPKKSYSLQLNKSKFLSILKTSPEREKNIKSFSTITLPTNNDDFETFEIYQTSNFSKELAEKFPEIKSYVGKSTSSNKTARFSYSKYNGLIASITTNKGTIIVRPTNINTNSYVVFNRKDSEIDSDFECETIEKAQKVFNDHHKAAKMNDTFLRRYRLAVATTGEFANFFLTGNETNDEERKAVVLAAINSSMTRINGIFERDFGITMQLVANNDAVIYLDGNTDPFNGSFNSELQSTLDAQIGSDNYDVGHLFAFEDSIYGNAGCIACVCTDGSKGSGYTVHSDPSSDHFNMIASHEFGHQFGGWHVQSSSLCRSSNELQEVEPGSGSSIMGYAGICPANVQDNPDDYFNYVDIRDVIQWTRNDSSCAELIETGNNEPTSNAGNNYTIPRSTAFVLEGTGNDIDNNSTLSYCWEENDPENPNSSNAPEPTRAQGPMFRSKLPVDSPVRYMPQLDDVIAGNLTPTWEVVPSIGRTMDFVLTVRDNSTFGPKTASDEMTVTVDENSGPFVVTSQNTATNWNVGETETITWDVANTNQAPINETKVDIYLSTDGGYTYPIEIAKSVENNGSHTFIVPEIPTSTNTCRVMVKAVDNIFFAINASNIDIQVSEFVMSFSNNNENVCKPNNAVFNFNYRTFLGFNETTTFSIENLPNGLNASFSPRSATNNDTPVTLTISGTSNINIGSYNFTVVGNSSSVEKRTPLTLSLYEDNITTPSLNLPENNTSGIEPNSEMSWNDNENAQNYNIEIATDPNFTSLVVQETINTNTFTPSEITFNTTYYWRVKTTNECGESNFSNAYSFTTQCEAPTNINITNITSSSAEISWIDSSSSNWEIEVVPVGNAPTGSGVNTSVNPYTATNLNSGTEYNVYVKSLCGSDNSSAWIGPIKFTTLPNYCNGDKFYDTGGPNGNYEDNETITTTILPENADAIEVIFSVFNTEAGFDSLFIYDGNDTNANLIGTYTGNNSPGTVRSRQGQGLTFVFSSDGSVTSSGWEASVNCITITCPEPTNLIVDNILGNSADLSWTSNGSETKWQIEYGLQGFTTGSGTTVITESNPTTLENLQPLTNYDIYVKAICGENPTDDDSFTVGPYNFTTNCGIINAPYEYGVESQPTNTIIADCWEGIPEAYQSSYFWEANFSTFNTNTETGPYKAHEGNIYFRTNPYNNASNGGIAELLMPVVDISSLTSPVLQFNSFLFGEKIGSLRVDIFHNNEWTNDVFVLEGQQQTSSEALWDEHLIDLSNYSGEIQIKFRGVAGGNSLNEIAIDDINIIETPSCPNPTSFTASNITSTSVDLAWNSNGSENKWQIEFGQIGFNTGSGTTVEVTTNPFTLNNLPSNTELDIYLKAICGTNVNDNDSEYIGPLKIKTPCGIFQAPYLYNVETQNNTPFIQDCWESTPIFNDSPSYLWVSASSKFFDAQTGPYTANSGNFYFQSIPNGSSNTGDTAELYMPEVEISALNNPALNFYSYLYGQNIGSLRVDIKVNGNWINNIFVLEEQQQNESNQNWGENWVDLAQYSGTIQIRFRAISGNGNLNEIAIDDISITELPNCPNPTNLQVDNITQSSAILSWRVNGSENQWEIEYGETGFSPGNGTTLTVNENPFLLDNLDSGTKYDVYLTSVCNSDNSNIIGPLSFTTQANYCNGDRFYDSGGANGNYSDNENYTTTIFPTDGNNSVTVTFNSFQLEGCCDYLYIYDGDSVNATLVGSYNGNNNPGTIRSTSDSGALTFVFTSDGSVTYEGWDATVTCEKITCPNPTNVNSSNITVNSVDIAWTNGGSETNWIIEYGITGFTPGNGTSISVNQIPYTLTGLSSQTTYDVYVKADCGNGDISSPFQPITISTTPDYCTGDKFYDTGGADGSYSNGENYTTTIYPSTGYDRVSVIFDSFSTESCCDALTIYDGPDTSAQIIGTYQGIISPGEVTSTHSSGALTFVFNSDGSATDSGWEATVNCFTGEYCSPPSEIGLQLSNGNSVTLNWTDNTTNSQTWEVEYGLQGFLVGNGTRTQTNSTSATISNLPAPQTLDFYVRAICEGNNNNSTWVGPYSATTNCSGTVIAPYAYDVESQSNPPSILDCWSKTESNPDFYFWEVTESQYNNDDSTGPWQANSGELYFSTPANFMAEENNVAELITPSINISNLQTPGLGFAYFMYGEKVGSLHIDIFQEGNWTNDVFVFSGQQQTDANVSWGNKIIDLTDYDGIIQIRFRAIAGGDGTSEIALDDILVDELNVLSTDTVSNIERFKFYPNPVKDELTIQSNEEITKIEIYNLLGQKLISLQPKTFSQKIFVDVSQLSTGSYIIRGYSNNKIQSFKIIKE